MTVAEYRLRLIAAAEAWERAAETARLAGNFNAAAVLSDRARRNRWLAEPDPELDELFEEYLL